MNEECLIWIEKAYSKIHKPYYAISITISLLILCTFYFFSLRVPMLVFDFWYEIEIALMAILIALQQIMIIYILNNIKRTISDLDFVSDEYFKNIIYFEIANKYKLKYIILINILILSPFFWVDFVQISRGEANSFYLWLHTSWSLLLDIYNYFLSYLINYFISIQLFINLSILYLISTLDKRGYKTYIKLNDVDRSSIGVASLLSLSTTFYFVSLTLAIITYIGPFGLITIQSAIYILLILIGLFIFILARKYLKKIFNDKIKDETDKLYRINEACYENIFQESSNKNNINKEDTLFIILKIDIVNIMIIRLSNMKFHFFDSTNIAQLALSFISSILAVSIKMTLASQLVNYLSIIFHLN